MKRSLFYVLVLLALIGLTFIVIDKNTAFAPNLVEAEIEDPGQGPKQEPKIVEKIIEQPKIKEIEIVAVGDIMFHMPQINGARLAGGGFDFSPSFKYIKPYIENADIAIANLETVIGGNEKGFNGFPRFNSPVESLDALKSAGFDVLVTANNHSLDGGKSGIINTITEIENRNLEYIGTSKEDRRPFIIIEKDGIKIGLLAYTYGLNGLDSLLTNEERSRMTNLIDTESMQKDIENLNNKDVDFIISYIHWGNEYHRDPSKAQRELADNLARFGVDMILGSHPHVIQTSERIVSENSSTYVIYSMGNFISNQRYETMGVSYTEDGVVLRAKITKDDETGLTRLEEVAYEPTWIYREWENKKYTHYIIPLEKALNGEIDIDFTQSIVQRLQKSQLDTLNTLNNP